MTSTVECPSGITSASKSVRPASLADSLAARRDEARQLPKAGGLVIRWLYAFIDRPASRFGAALDFWAAVTATAPSARRGDSEEFVTLLSGEADPFLKVQAVGDNGGIHLDLCVDDVRLLAHRAVDLGAAVEADHGGYIVLRSPAGQLFCAVSWGGEAQRPLPVGGPGGSDSRVDQVAIDVAPDRFEAEIAFWAALTDWGSHRGALPEFHLVKPSAELPLRIMVQRLDGPGPTRGHLDVACGDVAAVRAWHEQAGATVLAERPLWTVMRDPAGGVYCLTSRLPATGSLPPAASG